MKNCAVVASILLMISIGCVPIVLMSCSNEIPVYTVRFDSQVGNAIVEMTVLKGSKIAEPKSPIRDNYEFEGWYKDSDLTSAWNFISDTVTSDITLYAKWNATAYLVTYNGNGNDKGTVPLTQEKTHGINLELAVNSGDLQRTGYSFTGWNTEVDGTGIDYAEGSTYTTDVALTLYAKWTASKYSVTYDANGATDGTVPDVQSKNHGINLVLASNNNGLAKEGYSFSGWNTQADGFGTDYAEGSTYTSDGALTLYAKWVANTYSVTYDANGATRGTVPNPQSKAHGENLVLAGNEKGLERAGYSFSGWNTHSEGTGDGYLEEGTYAVDAAIILYAKWVPDTYLVTYDANGASEGAIPDSQRKYHDADLSVRANSGNLLRTGYVFTGWNTQADGSGRDYLEGGIYTSNMSLILYAKWISLHSVMFDTLGGSSIPPIEGVKYGSTIGAPDSPMKEDYIFDGWYCDNKYGDEWDFPNQTVTTDITLYAKWLVAHTVHFDSQGGNAVSSLINILHGYKIEEPAVPPVKAGYTFAGWYKTTTYDEAWDFDIDVVDTDVTLYARWIVARYSVVFDSRGGSPVLLTENIGYGEMLSAPVSPTRVGYVFDGWYKESETVNQWYFTVDKVVASITLYAKWLGPYVVEFDSIGGSHIPLLDAVVHGETISEPVAPARDGYKFAGWYRDANYQNIWNFSNDAVISDITLYAKWIPIYRVSFDSQGGSPVESVDTPSGSYISAPEAPTKIGSVFGGWYKENTWKNLWQFGSYPVRSNITLYAKWLGPYVVQFDSQGGSSVSIVKNIIHGERISEPETPTKNGYMFGGWYKDNAYKNEWKFVSDTVKSDMTLYAKWNPLFLVSFDSLGGTGIGAVEIPSGSLITEPEEPIKNGYMFDGWYKESDCINIWDFCKDTVTSNKILYSKWLKLYSVSFNTHDGSDVENVEILSGAKIFEPKKPIKNNYLFGGWYKDIECTDPWNFVSDIVYSNVTLYARWITIYSISYELQKGENSIANPNVYTAISPEIILEDPSRTGYIFKGWFTDSDYNSACYSIPSGSSGDIKLYAKWEIITYQISYDGNGATDGSAPSVQRKLFGEAIAIEQNIGNLSKLFYNFAGWNTKPDGSGVFYPVGRNYTLNNDLELFAVWEVKPPTKIVLPMNIVDDYFGDIVDISNDTMIVGTRSSIYVYTKISDTWVYQTKLQPMDSSGKKVDISGYIGRSVDISSNRIVLGVPQYRSNGMNTGTVFIFQKSGNSWIQETQLLPNDGGTFGKSVAIFDDKLIIGDPEDNHDGNSSGKAHIYSLIDGVWEEVAALYPKVNENAYTKRVYFGETVAISADTAAVGTPRQGKVYIYDASEGWNNSANVTGTGSFGSSIDIWEDTLVVGCPTYDDHIYLERNEGCAVVFQKTGTEWDQITRLEVPFDPNHANAKWDANFGYVVSINDNVISIADYRYLYSKSSKVYMYYFVDGVWKEFAMFPQIGSFQVYIPQRFIALSSSFLLVGSNYDEGNGEDSGCAYIYSF